MPWKNTPSITAKKALLPGEILSQRRSVLLFMSEIGHLRRLELQGQFVCDQGDEFRSNEIAAAISYSEVQVIPPKTL